MIKKFIYISLIWMVFHGASLHAATLLVEAESFTEKGGWVVDQQDIKFYNKLIYYILYNI